MQPSKANISGDKQGFSTQDLEAKLRSDLNPTHLEVIDESEHHAGHAGLAEFEEHASTKSPNNTSKAKAPGGTHYRILIASPAFEGLNRVSKHRLVYASLQRFIDQGVHALAIEVL
jgi:BolA family transcriptional regulator, general stress-responsive regulator